ncbi:putative transposase [Arthrospira platensis C1]|nr:putative transposase [Arthrospira platensis C1]
MLPSQAVTNVKSLSIPELVVAPTKATSTDGLPHCPTSTPKQKSSPKTEAGSTSRERKCWPDWDIICQEMSAWLSLPTQTDWQYGDLTCFDGSANKTGVNSWFSTRQVSVQNQKWLRTSSPSSTALAPDSSEQVNTKLRSKKIRIYPSPELNQVWRKWLAACRYCYNQAIALQKSGKRLSKLKLRNEVMQSDLPEWVKETPCHIRQNAIFDAHLAFSASPGARFRSCRDSSQAIKFNDANFSSGSWYPRLTKGLTFKVSEPILSTCDQGTQLVFSKGQWFAVFPKPVAVTPTEATGVIALDPGVRTFMTGFDGSKFLEFGSGDIGRITRLCQHLDDLMSRIASCPSKKRRRRMRRAAQRMRIKIRNLIDEAHKQIAHYLTRNYSLIFLPTFETSDMVAKAKRKIRSKTARAMLTWAHYRFKLTLRHQGEITGTTVVDVTEEYTSKTCTHCGHVHSQLGGSKVFRCPECGFTLPRDWNGAFGIFLKVLRDTASVTLTGNSAIVALSGNSRINVA